MAFTTARRAADKSYWKNVSHSQPCPICGKTDWCAISIDSAWVCCRRMLNPGGEIKYDSSGNEMYVHCLDPSRKSNREISRHHLQVIPTETEPKHVDHDLSNRVYRALLEILALLPEHRENLLQRGIPENEITRRGYRTYPGRGRSAIARKLLEKFRADDLAKVPGFYLKRKEGSDGNGNAVAWWSMTGRSGIAIPVRDLQRRIIGLIVRDDDPDADPKYKWISSAGNNRGGLSPGTPCHIPGHDFTDYSTLWGTEGQIKADIVTIVQQQLCLGISGVGAWRRSIPILKELRPQVYRLAWDADARRNRCVASQLYEYVQTLLAEGINVEMALWDPALGKGIDDVLVAHGIAAIQFVCGPTAILAETQRILSEAIAADPSPHEIELREARERVVNLGEKLDSPEFLNDPKTIEALILIQQESPGDWLSQIKPLLSKRKILRDIERMMKEAGAVSVRGNLQVVDEEYKPAANPVRRIFPDAPVPDSVVVPQGWEFNTGGIFRTIHDMAEVVSHVPAIISRRMVDIHNQDHQLEISWKANNHWDALTAPREQVMSSNSLVSLAKKGLVVSTSTAGNLARWFSDFEIVNIDVIEALNISSQFGWQRRQMATFLLGNQYLQGKNVEPESLEFRPTDSGADLLAKSIHTAGKEDVWIEAIQQCEKFPEVMLGIFASLAAPLLSLVCCPCFYVNWSGMTSCGKTTVLRLASSVWGMPDEYLQTWNLTPTWLERISTTLQNLPVILDDTKRVRKSLNIDQLIYTITSGHGRGRGTVSGTQQITYWRTVFLSTGESPICHVQEDIETGGGARTRGIERWCPRGPFGAINSKISMLINHLNGVIDGNYGLAGRRLIEWILADTNRVKQIQDLYVGFKQQHEDKIGDMPMRNRLIPYYAAIETAQQVFCWLYGWEFKSIFDSEFIESCGREVDEGDRPAAAMLDVISWCVNSAASFWNSNLPEAKEPPGGWLGRWDRPIEDIHPDWVWIGIAPDRLRRYLRDNRYNSEEILRVWRDRGWLHLSRDEREKSYARVAKLHDNPTRLIILRREIIAEQIGNNDESMENNENLPF